MVVKLEDARIEVEIDTARAKKEAAEIESQLNKARGRKDRTLGPEGREREACAREPRASVPGLRASHPA